MTTKNIPRTLYVASMACVIHCVGTPLIITALPFLGGLLDSHIIELSLLIISILSGLVILYASYRKHKKVFALLWFGFGASLWGLHSLFEYLSISGAKLLFYLGTVCVILAYYKSQKQLKDMSSGSCDHL